VTIAAAAAVQPAVERLRVYTKEAMHAYAALSLTWLSEGSRYCEFAPFNDASTAGQQVE
jgi:hypothetical protein